MAGRRSAVDWVGCECELGSARVGLGIAIAGGRRTYVHSRSEVERDPNGMASKGTRGSELGVKTGRAGATPDKLGLGPVEVSGGDPKRKVQGMGQYLVEKLRYGGWRWGVGYQGARRTSN